MAAMMAVTLIPTVTFAEDETSSIPYIYRDGNNLDGEERICSDYTYVTEGNVPRTFTNGWYVFKKGSIECDFRPEVTGTDVNFIIMDGCDFEGRDGLRIASGSHLTIYGQKGGGCNFGLKCTKSSPLGGNQEEDARSASLTINGGYVNARGEDGAAGIGAGKKGTFGDITINGGHVTGWGGGDAAGIGGSEYGGPIKTITINGGLIDAIGGDKRGAGIGGGDSSQDGGRIIINGGTVCANGGGGNDWHGALEQGSGAAIGGGRNRTGPYEITITGGEVIAEGTWYGAGIGGGYGGSSGDITITGGDIEVSCGDRSAGIGGGAGGGIGEGRSVLITGGRVKVTPGVARGSQSRNTGAGIGGGGYSAQGGDIVIQGGEVSVESWAGAGIGGGGAYGHSAGNITISGGTVAASSRTGAGIGGGGYDVSFDADREKGDGGNVTISGGHVFASSLVGGAAIGGGAGRNGGKLTITDGYVVATTSPIKYDWVDHINTYYSGYSFGADIASAIGNLLMKELLSDPQDRSPAAIGGGFVPTPQGGDAGDFKMTGGVLIAKSGRAETPAIGKGDSSESSAGSWHIGDGLTVWFSEDMSKTPLDMEYADDHLEALKTKPYIMIDKCNHEEKSFYDDGDTHFYICQHCKKEVTEPHTWAEHSYLWARDYSDVTAKCRCSVCGAKREETVETKKEVNKEATCTEKGEVTYTAEFTGYGFEKQTKTVETSKAEHKWDEGEEIQAQNICGGKGTLYTCTVCSEQKLDSPRGNHLWGPDWVAYTAPTCTESGESYLTCVRCGAFDLENPSIHPPKGHWWTLPKMEPSEDMKTVTATRECQYDPSHIETETAETKTEITKPATCEDPGEFYYVAHFENGAFYQWISKAMTIKPLGHDWDKPIYLWSEDNTSVTADRYCKNNRAHVETETVKATSEITKPATCREMGETTYTAAEFEKDCFEMQTKTVANIEIDPNAHDWGKTTYTWANDNGSVIASRRCSNNASHVENEMAKTTSKVSKAPTCTEKGVTTYTSADFDNKAFETQKKTVANINATGHKYGAWKKLNATQHQRVCACDKTHVQKANHTWDKGKVTKKATEKASGIKTYTCTVCKAIKTQAIPKLAPKVSGTLIGKMTAKGSNGLIIGWTKVSGAAGYDIFLARCNHDGKKISCKKVKTIKAGKTFKWTKTGLKKGASYKAYVKAFVYKSGKKSYVRTSPMMHAYTGNGTKYYTNARSVTVNKTTVTLKKGNTFTIKATVNKVSKNKKLMPKGHAPTVRYITSNSKIATVSSGGRITAKGKGTCYIYAFAHNGVSKKVKVTVK